MISSGDNNNKQFVIVSCMYSLSHCLCLEICRKKYELHQFMDPKDCALCPYQQPSKINDSTPSLCSANHRSTKNRIGNAFRNSWGRRESDHKGHKKSNSLVSNHYTYIHAYMFSLGNTVLLMLVIVGVCFIGRYD